MNNVKVNVQQLLTILKKNRDSHRKIFLEAQEGYRKLAIKELDKTLKDARDGKKFARMLSLVAPQDMTKEYDTAIGMLEMSVDKDIVITYNQYQNFVQDEWHWKENFLLSNSTYSKTASAEYRKNYADG